MPAAEEGAAVEAAQALLVLFGGYATLLATPGPNMLAVGGIAAAGGFARALPLCLGIVAGVASLAGAAGLLAAAGSAVAACAHGGGGDAWRVLGAALLAWVAFAQARSRTDGDQEAVAGRGGAFCAGFCTAATNPLTMAFFAAQSAAGPLGGAAGGWAPAAAALLGVAAMALGFYLGMAALMANPAARRAALRWGRAVRPASAAALMLSAAAVLRPVLLR